MKIQKRGLLRSGIITGADKEGQPLHTFAVCAYKDSPYLEACIRSLTEQQVKTDVICCTSTPSPYIEKITKKYAVPLYVREGESNIREDWLFAWHKAGGRLVTIAHQDDVYRSDYTKELYQAFAKYPDMSVFVSDYMTLKMTERGMKTELRLAASACAQHA